MGRMGVGEGPCCLCSQTTGTGSRDQDWWTSVMEKNADVEAGKGMPNSLVFPLTDASKASTTSLPVLLMEKVAMVGS